MKRALLAPTSQWVSPSPLILQWKCWVTACDTVWQHLLRSCNIVTTSHKNILLRLDRDNVRYNSRSWHVMTVFIIETFFGERSLDIWTIKCSKVPSICCVFVVFMQLLQEVQIYLKVSWRLLLLSPPWSYAERGKWKAERLDNGGRGSCRVSVSRR